jgi:hypothetical protein
MSCFKAGRKPKGAMGRFTATLGLVAGMFLNTSGRGSMGMGGHSMPKSTTQTGHSLSKRQDWMMNLLPQYSVFVGGGGSVGSSSVFAVKNSRFKSGAYVGPSDSFLYTSEVVNYDPVDKDVYLTLDFEWLPKKTKSLLNTGMGFVGLNCTSFAFQPPKNKPMTYSGVDWTALDNGYFVDFMPHLHDGGVNIKVHLNGESASTIG